MRCAYSQSRTREKPIRREMSGIFALYPREFIRACAFPFPGEKGAAFVHTFHTLYEQYTKYIPIGKHLGAAALAGWMRYRLRAADVCIAPTEKVERTLLGYGIENSIAVIPTGIRLERFGRTADQEER